MRSLSPALIKMQWMSCRRSVRVEVCAVNRTWWALFSHTQCIHHVSLSFMCCCLMDCGCPVCPAVGESEGVSLLLHGGPNISDNTTHACFPSRIMLSLSRMLLSHSWSVRWCVRLDKWWTQELACNWACFSPLCVLLSCISSLAVGHVYCVVESMVSDTQCVHHASL